MNGEELDRQLDEWIDRAAGEYGRAETRPGLETRVLARLNSRLERNRRFRWLPVAASVAALMSLFLIVLRTEFQDRERTDFPSKRAAGRVDNSAERLHAGWNDAPVLHSPVRRTSVGSKSKKVERGRFLSTGLSDQERYLIAFARAVSEQEITGFSEGHDFEPLHIPEFEVPEFRIPEFHIAPFKIQAFRTPMPETEEES